MRRRFGASLTYNPTLLKPRIRAKRLLSAIPELANVTNGVSWEYLLIFFEGRSREVIVGIENIKNSGRDIELDMYIFSVLIPSHDFNNISAKPEILCVPPPTSKTVRPPLMLCPITYSTKYRECMHDNTGVEVGSRGIGAG
jgi:hypothetical protein